MTICLVWIAWLLLPAGAWAAAESGTQIEGVAAIVGDEVILRSEVKSAAAPGLARLAAAHGGQAPPELERQLFREAMQSAIDSRLLTAAARRMNLETTAEEVSATIEEIASEEGLTTEELYAEVEAQGLSQEQYRQELTAQITRMRVISVGVRARMTVPEAEIEELYNQRYAERTGRYARLRHILIPWPAPATAAERERTLELTENIREAILGGKDFAELARRYSAAPSAKNGGLMDLQEGTAVAELAGPAFSLAPGEISPVIETRHGANLIEVIERFDPREVEYEAVRDALYQELFERATRPEVEKFLKELREERYVEVIAPDLK